MATKKKEEIKDTTTKSPVFIEAVKGSRRFDSIVDFDTNRSVSEIKSYKQVAKVGGVEYSEDLGTFSKQKFPGTRQSQQARFSISENRFLIYHDDGSFVSQAEIDKYVEKIPLRYSPYYRIKELRDTRIKSSDLTDSGDPFLTHDELRIDLYEGDNLDEALNPNTPIGELRLAIARGMNNFMTETADMISSSEVEYVIREPEIAEKRSAELRNKKELAYEYYNGMKTNPDRMLKIIRLFNMDVSESASAEMMRNILFDKFNDDVSRERGQTMQDLFIYFAELTEDQLDLRSMLSLASLRKIILDKPGLYEFQGTPLGENYEAMVNFLGKAENGSIRKAIEISLKADNV